jgi:DNA polymerase-3 subunit epsilon
VIIELGMVEIVDGEIGDTWQSYFSPGQAFGPGTNMIDPDAKAIHGLTEEFLADMPKFHSKVKEILQFIGRSTLVIHNAPFDLSFLGNELFIGQENIKNEIIDTCAASRELYPGQPASLDACLDRYGIDRSARTKHGALIDATLLAELFIRMYSHLVGGLKTRVTGYN